MQSKDITKLIREVEKSDMPRGPFTVKRQKNGHYGIRDAKNRLIATLPFSPNAYGINYRRQLEKAGVLRDPRAPEDDDEEEAPAEPLPEVEVEAIPDPRPISQLLKEADRGVRYHVQGRYEAGPGDWEWRTWYIVQDRRFAAGLGRVLRASRVVDEFDIVAEWLVFERHGGPGLEQAHAQAEWFADQPLAGQIVSTAVRSRNLASQIEDIASEWRTAERELALLIDRAIVEQMSPLVLERASGLSKIRLIKFRRNGRLFQE